MSLRSRAPGWRGRALVTAVTVALAACTSSPARPGANPGSSGAAPVLQAPAGQRDIGAGVFVPATLTATMTARAVTAPNPFPKVPHGSLVFSVSTAAEPAAPTTITLPLLHPAGRDDLPVVVTRANPTGPWTPVPTRLSADRLHVVATVTHFSWFTALLIPVKEALGIARGIVDSALSGLTQDASAPTCQNTTAARASWKVESSSGNTLLWCFGLEGGQHVLHVTSNRHYALVLTHPGAVKTAGGADDIWQLATWVAKLYSTRTLLLPGDSATYTIANGAAIRSQADGMAQAITSLQVGLETLGAILVGDGLISTTLPWQQVAQLVMDALAAPKCATTLQHPSDIGTLFTRCLDSGLLYQAFGPWGATAGLIMMVAPIIEYFQGAASGLVDIATGRDTYTITAASQGVDVHQVDWPDVSVPGSVCGVPGVIPLSGGQAYRPTGSLGPVTFLAFPTQMTYGDIDGDGQPEAALNVWCEYSPGGRQGWTAASQSGQGFVIFTGAGGLHILGLLSARAPRPANSTHVSYLGGLHLGPGTVSATEVIYGPNDPDCCPSGRATSTWELRGGQLVPASTVVATPPALTGPTFGP